MTITTHPAARPANIHEAVDLYEARLRQFEHLTRTGEGQADNARVAKARRLLLLAEQYLAEHDAHADYQSVASAPGIRARVISSSGRSLRIVREDGSR